MPDPVQPVQPEAAPAAAAPEAAAPVAAPEGQGQADTSSGLYSLDAIPEAIRDEVAPYFKEWDGNVTRKFQQNAEQWKPYEELGIRDIDPQEMGHLVDFHRIASDEDAFKDWVKSAYDELHGEGAAAANPEAAAAAAGEQPQYLTQEQFEAKMEEREAQREQEREAQELHDTIAHEARETLDTVLKEVPFPKDATDEDKQRVEDLICFMAQKHQSPDGSVGDALKAGYADYQKLIGGAKSDALDEKLSQPKPAETGGRAASQPTVAESFEEAGQRLRERMRASAAV